jgi:hypothetical protein
LGDFAHENGRGIGSLKMSLEIGLGKLSGLKKLKEVSVLGLGSIGVEEVQWMVANWPKLCIVDGTLENEATAWLEKNTDIACP